MRALTFVMLVGVLLGGATIGASEASADGRKDRGYRHARDDDRDDRRYGRGDWDDDDDRHGRRDRRYFSGRDVRIIRGYYGPRVRYAHPRACRHYHRARHLPHGWHRRVRPIPVYVERELIVLPHGYRRGIIDGHAVVYNSRGLIIDVAVLF